MKVLPVRKVELSSMFLSTGVVEQDVLAKLEPPLPWLPTVR